MLSDAQIEDIWRVALTGFGVSGSVGQRHHRFDRLEMTARRIQISLVALSTVLLCAFMAQNSPAAESGTFAATCVKGAGADNYTDAHCDSTSGGGPGTGSYGIEQFTESSTAGVEATNAATKNSTTEATQSVLEVTIAGVAIKLEATTMSATGAVENKTEGEVHKILGSGITITYTGVSVIKPANCKVHSPGKAAETVVTKTLKSESVEGTPMTEKFSPKEGTVLAELEFEGASCAISGITANVTGTVSGEPSGQMTAEEVNTTGATLIVNVTKASAQLKVGVQNASLTATTTAKSAGGNAIVTTGPKVFEFKVLMAAELIGSELEETVFGFGAMKEVKCKNVTYKGFLNQLHSRFVLAKPQYPECEGLGFLTAKVEPHSCELELNGPDKTATAGLFKVKAAIKACGGTKILIKAPAVGPECEVEIAQQNGNGAPKVENTTIPKTLRVDPTLSNLTYTVTKSVGTCPLAAGVGNNGTYVGQFELNGKEIGGVTSALLEVNE
jgi:hypothetical protein